MHPVLLTKNHGQVCHTELRPVHFRSFVADAIRATRDAVTCLDDSNSDCEFDNGLNRPRPPNLGGRASSKGEQEGRPVMVEMK